MGMLQNLKHFVDTRLMDVVNWNAHVRVPSEREKSRHSDEDRIEIRTPYNVYGLMMQSPYLSPPLGKVDLHHKGEIVVTGPHKDDTWSEMARYIHAQEIPAAQATAHAKVTALAAQGSSNELALARVRVAELEALATKWKLPEFNPSRADDGRGAEARPSELPQQPVAAGAPVVRPAPPDGRMAHQGQMVSFHPNPGEYISGMAQVCAVVTRVISPTIVSLLVIPEGGDPFHREHLQRRVEGAKGQGWDFADDDGRLENRVRHLEEAIGIMADEGNRVLARLAALEAAAAAVPPKETLQKPAAKRRAA